MSNKIIKTPHKGVEVELKEFLTGKEGKEIKAPMTNVKMKMDASGNSTTELDVGKAMEESKKIAANTVIVKIAGKEIENPYDEIGNMIEVDYIYIMEEVDSVVSGANFTKPSKKPEDGIA